MHFVRRHIRALALSIFFLAPLTAHAQESPTGADWDIHRLVDQKATIATAAFNNGITLISRCSKGVFDLILTGLPSASGKESSRLLTLVLDNNVDPKPSSWLVGEDRTVAFSQIPAMLARQLATGGHLEIIAPAEPGGRRTRYIMELTRSGSAIEETLNACDRPLVDPRDLVLQGDGGALPDGIIWTRLPRPNFPNGGTARAGYVTLSCLAGAEGRAQDCQVESEQPPGANFARAALRSMDAARLGLTDQAIAAGRPAPSGLIVFTISFRLE